MKPLVTIIIPSYNKAKYISETLDSVLAQHFKNWECIIIDDGSSDNTYTIAQKYSEKDARFICVKKDSSMLKGPSLSRNIGIEHARGAYIIFLDADDVLAPFCLEQRITTFKKHHDNDFLVFKMQRFETVPIINKPEVLIENASTDVIRSFLRLNALWQVTSPIYKTTFLKKIKGFHKTLTNFEDLELAIRSIYHSNGFLNYKNIDAYYRNDHTYKNRYSGTEARMKILKAFTIFLKSIHEELISQIKDEVIQQSYKQDIVIAYKRLFLNYFKNNINDFKNHNKHIINFLFQKKYLSLFEALKFYVVQYIVFKVYNVKGIGVYKFMRNVYKID